MNRGDGSSDQTNSSQNRNLTGNNNNSSSNSANNNFVTLIPIDYNTNGQPRGTINRSQYHTRHPTGEGGLRTASVSSVSSSSSVLSTGGSRYYIDLDWRGRHSNNTRHTFCHFSDTPAPATDLYRLWTVKWIKIKTCNLALRAVFLFPKALKSEYEKKPTPFRVSRIFWMGPNGL